MYRINILFLLVILACEKQTDQRDYKQQLSESSVFDSTIAQENKGGDGGFEGGDDGDGGA